LGPIDEVWSHEERIEVRSAQESHEEVGYARLCACNMDTDGLIIDQSSPRHRVFGAAGRHAMGAEVTRFLAVSRGREAPRTFIHFEVGER